MALLPFGQFAFLLLFVGSKDENERTYRHTDGVNQQTRDTKCQREVKVLRCEAGNFHMQFEVEFRRTHFATFEEMHGMPDHIWIEHEYDSDCRHKDAIAPRNKLLPACRCARFPSHSKAQYAECIIMACRSIVLLCGQPISDS